MDRRGQTKQHPTRLTNESRADVVEELQPIQDHIDHAREALQNNDTAKTLGELNSRFRTA
jgi:uncharacterized protein YicC (UPF0701 family)